MVGVLTQPIEPNRRLLAQGLDALPASTDEVLGAAFDDAWARSAGPSLWRWAGRELADSPIMSADTANKEFGIDGHLHFKTDVPEHYARELHELKRQELERRSILSRGEGGFLEGAGQLGAGLLGTAIDPLNLASAFIPVVGPTRYGMMLAGAGSFAGRTVVRVGVGAVEGAVGAALLEPIVYGVAKDEQADYDAVDSLLNLTFGSVLGGTLHAAGGGVGEALGRRWRSPVEARIGDVPFETHESLVRGAVAALAEDHPMSGADEALALGVRRGGTVDDLLAGASDAGASDAAVPSRRARSRGARAQSDLGSVFDGSGRRLDVRYELDELDRLITSHDDALSINPRFPAELQPRERSRVVSQRQIDEIVQNFQADRLGRSPDAATGAPIVGKDGVVESGNGRSLALRRIYQEHPDKADQYRAALVRQGYAVEGWQRPVLVARRLTDLAPDERRDFTVAAQDVATLKLSSTERAVSDARLVDDLMPLHAGGDVGLARNMKFVRGFLSKLPQADQGAMLAADGSLSRVGRARIEAAILARAYDDTTLLSKMLEMDDGNSRALTGALLDVAPHWAALRAAVVAGDVAPNVDATADLLAAVRTIRDARAAKRPLDHVLRQIDAFDQRSPATEMFLGEMLNGNSTASREAIAGKLQHYVDEAMKSRPGPDLFGTAPADRETLLRALFKNDPTKPPADDIAILETVEQSVQTLEQRGVAEPDRLAAEEATLRDDVARLQELGLLRGDELELHELTRIDADSASRKRALSAAAFCMSRRG